MRVNVDLSMFDHAPTKEEIAARKKAELDKKKKREAEWAAVQPLRTRGA